MTLRNDVLDIVAREGKIAAIKHTKSELTCGLKVAKDLVENWIELDGKSVHYPQVQPVYCVYVDWNAKTFTLEFADGTRQLYRKP